jgi:hypothetical protein
MPLTAGLWLQRPAREAPCDERIFVQCKFSTRPFSVRKVEQTLHKASSFVKENLCSGSNYFDLVIPYQTYAFPEAPVRRGRRPVNLARSAFLRYNSLQSLVKLRIREVELSIPDP